MLVKRRTRGAMGGAARPPFRIRPYVIYQAILRLRHEQRGMARGSRGKGFRSGGNQPPCLLYEREVVAAGPRPPPGTAGIPNSYADVEIDEAVLREYYGWRPDMADPSYEHEISPRELEVSCEADECPPVDQPTFAAWAERSDFPYAQQILAIARKTAPAAAPWDGIRRAMQAKAQEKRGEEEGAEENWENAQEELRDDTAGMLRARNVDRVPLGWFAALIEEGPEGEGGGINDAPEERPDHLAEIAQELEVVRCLNAAPPSAEGTYHWPEPERQAQDEGAKEQVAEQLIENAQQPGFFRGERPPAPRSAEEGAAPGGGGGDEPPGEGFAGTPPASLASLPGGPGAPPRPHPDPEHNKRERLSQAQVLRILSEDFPGYIRMAFPKVFQAGRGCPTEKPADLEFLSYCLRGVGRAGFVTSPIRVSTGLGLSVCWARAPPPLAAHDDGDRRWAGCCSPQLSIPRLQYLGAASDALWQRFLPA